MSNENYIYWSHYYELKLSDFKKEFDEKDRPAFSNIGYDLKYIIKYNEARTKYFIKNLNLQTFFVRDKSFFNSIQAKTKSQKQIDDIILHEQGHFDLAEEFLPMMKRIIENQCKGSFPTRGSNLKEIENNTKKDANEFVNEIYVKATFGDYKERQDIYDNETDHGRIEPRQNIYNARFKRFRKKIKKVVYPLQKSENS